MSKLARQCSQIRRLPGVLMEGGLAISWSIRAGRSAGGVVIGRGINKKAVPLNWDGL